MPTPTIRQAQPQDREGVVATVTAAFAEDPGWAFLMGEEYERLAPDFTGVLATHSERRRERLAWEAARSLMGGA